MSAYWKGLLFMILSLLEFLHLLACFASSKFLVDVAPYLVCVASFMLFLNHSVKPWANDQDEYPLVN